MRRRHGWMVPMLAIVTVAITAALEPHHSARDVRDDRLSPATLASSRARR